MLLSELNSRSREIFRALVDIYMETGEPVGSRTVSKRLDSSLSPATIRNIMADLEEMNLLYAPHTSAGRLPTHEGLKLFVKSFLEIDNMHEKDLAHIQDCFQRKNIDTVLEDTSQLLSGLSKCAGLVLAPKFDLPLSHIEFVQLSENRLLIILASNNGRVENRIVELEQNLSSLAIASINRYLNSCFLGKKFSEICTILRDELTDQQFDHTTKQMIAEWLALDEKKNPLIIKGQSHLLESAIEINDLETVRKLFSVLETQESLINLLDNSLASEGVQIFIGAENELFSLSGCSLVVSPYYNPQKQIIGALGVIGPSRMDYSRIVPLVDCTAKLLSKSLR